MPLATLVAEVAVENLRYKMIMALNAAGREQAAAICAEIAEQHCAQLDLTTTAQVIAVDEVATSAPGSLLRVGIRPPEER